MPESRIRLRVIGPAFDKDKKWEASHFLHIGRLHDQEVVLHDTSISRRHAEIALTEKGWVARDLGSTNGTFLNGVRLGHIGKPLSTRDLLQCGNVVLGVELLAGDCLDFNESPCGSIQVQAVARQSLEEAAQQLALEVTQSTQPGQQLLNLLQAGQFLHCTDSLDELLSRNLQNTVTSLGARRGAVVLIDNKTGKMNLRTVYPREPESGAGRSFSQTLAARCLRTGQSLLCADVIKDPEILEANSVNCKFMSSFICALLRSPQRYLGILHLGRGPMDEPFTRDDLRRADALAANMSFAFENAQQLQEKKQSLFFQTVIAFSQVIELRDQATAGHAGRVTEYALLLASEMKLSTTDRDLLRVGSPLHDIGKIGIDDAVLRKSGRLNPEEFEYMKSHTVKGAALLQTLPGMDVVLPIVRNHHERWDGSGYPDQLAGNKIPLLARLMAVVDSFDAMTMDRPYRASLPIDQALAEIEHCAGSQFDPDCARAFLQLRPVIQEHLSRQDSLVKPLGDMPVFLQEHPVASTARQWVPTHSNDNRSCADLALVAPGILAGTR